jgi:hypothetical protein
MTFLMLYNLLIVWLILLPSDVPGVRSIQVYIQLYIH